MSWLYHRPTEGTLAFIEASSPSGRRSPRRTRAPSTPAGTTARPPRTSPSRTRSRPHSSRPAVSADHRQPALSLRADRRLEALRAASLPRRVSDHAGFLDPRGARAPQGLRRGHVPGRGRDRGVRRRAGRGIRRLPRRHHLGRAGRRAQGRDGRARDHARAATARPRHPARRAVHRHADEAGASGPADGALRPELGEPRARDRCGQPFSASTPQSKRHGSRSSTARPSTSSPTRTSRTARSRG